jgi:transposase
VYVDESGINKFYIRERARALRGVKVHDTKKGRRYGRTNVIAGLINGRHVAVKTYTHTTKSEFFEDWFENELIPAIPKGCTVIMDNASFHRKERLKEIVKKHGVNILFLPSYSPDYNPIERSWANLKNWLKDNMAKFPEIHLAILVYFSCYRFLS